MYTESIKKLAAKMTVMVMLFISIFSFSGCGEVTESSGNATSGSTMIESTAVATETTTIVATATSIATTVTIASGTTQTSTIETTSVEKEVVDVTTIEETETNTTEETTESSTEQTTVITTKSIDDIAQEVINGSWGTGSERETRLTEAGYNYSDVQSKVNEIMSTLVTTSISSKSASVDNSSVEGTYEETTTETTSSAGGMTFVKTFTRGTFYAYGGARTGGSGRSLIDCSYGNGYVKGSIASSYLYRNYGYNYNGSRTMVYLEISGYPSMNGYYYLDDSDAGNSNVIDFFYYYNSNCQFQNQGVVTVNCYIVG